MREGQLRRGLRLRSVDAPVMAQHRGQVGVGAGGRGQQGAASWGSPPASWRTADPGKGALHVALADPSWMPPVPLIRAVPWGRSLELPKPPFPPLCLGASCAIRLQGCEMRPTVLGTQPNAHENAFSCAEPRSKLFILGSMRDCCGCCCFSPHVSSGLHCP